jgi:opine dehydrogenase
MWFTHLFVPQAVGIRLRSREFKGAVSELVAALKETERIENEALARRDVYAREEAGSTFIGRAVAVPHAATEAVNQPVIAHGYSTRGIRFGGGKKNTARHVFLVLGAPSSGPLHLRILARLARLLSSADFREPLDACENGQEFIALLQAHAESGRETIDLKEMPHVAVFASGPQGIGLAAHAALLGCRVRVAGPRSPEFVILSSMRGVNVEGKLKGFARFDSVDPDPETALADADLVFVGPPSAGYPGLADALGPHLHEGQAVVLVPGRLGGALAFARRLRDRYPGKRVYLCEAQFPLYECDMPSPAQVAIHRVNTRIPLSVLPGYGLPDVLSVLNSALPYFIAGGNALETGLRNFLTFFIPALAALNSPQLPGGRCPGAKGSGTNASAAKQALPPLRDLVDQPVINVLEALDEERIAVGRTLGIGLRSACEDLQETYGARGDSLLQTLLSVRDLEEPLICRGAEDPVFRDCVDFGLAPLVSLAAKLNVPAPAAGALSRLASIMLDKESPREGCTVDAMGLADLEPERMTAALESGWPTNGEAGSR